MKYKVCVGLIVLMALATFVDGIRMRIPMFFGIVEAVSLLYLSYRFPHWWKTGGFFSGMIAFFTICLILFLTGRLDVSTFTHSIVPFIFEPVICAGLWAFIVAKGSSKLMRRTLFLVLVPIVIMAFQTIKSPPNASRVFFGNAGDNLEMMYLAYDNVSSGVMGYGAIHSLPFLLVGCMAGVKYTSSRLMKLLSFLGVVICIATVIRSGYGACSVCMAVTFVFSAVAARRRIFTLFLLSMIGTSVLFLWFSGILLSTLVASKPYLPENSALIDKVNELESLVKDSAGSGYWNGRSELYAESIDTFLKSPLVGGEKTGGHSHVLDLAATTGLVGFIPYLLFNFYLCRFVACGLSFDMKWYFCVSACSLLVLLLFKANGLLVQNYVLFLILPMMLSCRDRDYWLARANVRKLLRMPRG